MYSELIYTRCGLGIDILRKCNPIKNSGFKVYSCSENITEDGFTDLPFLYTIAQSKESYSDPSFMDDAYLYIVPDIGEKYLLDFHPIPFDRNATGDYSHRPGNFINQIFIGTFDDIYPYETFGNDLVWDAQKRGEAYYYENQPAPLALRVDLGETIGNIGIDDIASFVADGRREAVMKSIAFIVSQYSLPPEKRKFLVIKDENSRKIELWIAAIECAFSPKMSSGLSFATRLDKFVNANKYTVNLNGQYQTQINLQSPNQKLRYRAMIVGVDERDKTNYITVKVLANLPYIVLDGKAKTLSSEIDIKNPYYQFVTSYDEEQDYFCRQFLQMVDVLSPSEDVLNLYSAFVYLSRFDSNKQTNDLISSLNILSQYILCKCSTLERIYLSVKQEMPRLLKENAVTALLVANWLESVAVIVGDDGVKESLKDDVCHSFADSLFMFPKSETTDDFLNAIIKSTFIRSVAEYISEKSVCMEYLPSTIAYKTDDWIAFCESFVKCIKECDVGFTETVNAIFLECLSVFYRAKDEQSAVRIVSIFGSINPEKMFEILIKQASVYVDQSYKAFLIKMVCRTNPKVVSSENNLIQFYKYLQTEKMGNYFSVVLSYKCQNLNSISEMESFIDWIHASNDFNGLDYSVVFKVIDNKIDISDKSAGKLALKIQTYKSKEICCTSSAHLYALDLLNDRKMDKTINVILKDLILQGFPTLEDEYYSERLIEKLLSSKLPDEIFFSIIISASKSSFYSNKIAHEAIKRAGTRQDHVLGDLFEAATKANSKIMNEALIFACTTMKQFEKGMSAIQSTISSKEAKQYFLFVQKEAKTLRDQTKDQTLFDRLFSRGPSYSDIEKKRKK